MKHCVIGRHGFIGGAIAAELNRIAGDSVTSFPVKGTEFLFHFGSYVHPDFEQNPYYLIKQTIDSFTSLLPYCHDHGIVFVYPSSALVYEHDTEFSRFKKTLESLVSCYKTRTVGVRLFPVYGPGEQRTVISQWCRQMKCGERPVIYGDGTQTRDFVYIEDAVAQILDLAQKSRWTSRLVDVGTGVRTSFNQIVNAINDELGTEIEPRYVLRPFGYSEGIVCQSPQPTSVSVDEGIRRILASL